jgi:O-methyltransferase
MNAIVKQLIEFDICRWDMFRRAARFVNYELVEGDILEFGCYTGRSLALLALADRCDRENPVHPVPFPRRVVGFDSFNGLPANEHPRWKTGVFRTNHSWHPTARQGEAVTPRTVLDLFVACGLEAPTIQVGEFSTVPADCGRGAIVHVDCDLLESARSALHAAAPVLQRGTVLLFDDWFNFRADPECGEQRAMREFLGETGIQVVEYATYATFAKAFIITRT